MENNNSDFEFHSTIDTDKMPQAGSRISAVQGTAVPDSDFVLVQQDKRIHDVKFTTKPTTFLKDALRRFRKDHSAIVGGVILGILFLLSIVLTIPGVLPYDTKSDHMEEINLPPKIHEASNGNWDGSRWVKGQAWPYSTLEPSDESYIGTRSPDPSVIVQTKDIVDSYGAHQSVDGVGGYLDLRLDPGQNVANFSSPAMTLDFNASLDATLTFGHKLDQTPDLDYALSLSTPSGRYVELTKVETMPEDAGESLDTEGGQTIAAFKPVSYDLKALVTENSTFSALLSGSGNVLKNVKLRLSVSRKSSASTASTDHLYLSQLLFATDSESEEYKGLLSDYSIHDANATRQLMASTKDSDAPRKWTTSIGSFVATDVRTRRCSILYDEYKIAYGYKSDTVIGQRIIQSWIDQGYVQYDFDAPTLNQDIRTEAGKAAKDVYVVSVQKDELMSGKDKDGNDYTYHNLTCTVLKYKQLGYASIPMHVLGTNDKGRDILKYDFEGLRTSLLLGIIVAAINIAIGLVWGSVSGYYGGALDLTMERITEILSGIPWIVLMTVISIKMGRNLFSFGLALCLTGWISTESVTRSQFYRYKNREYVLAARTLGAKSPRLIFRHILPNAIGTIVTSSVLMIPSVVFSEATISYLGLGLQNVASLGVILSDAQKYLSTYPYQLATPAVLISLLMICFNLFGNGLRDAFNPSLKGTE